jgi:hypothetical protein
VAEFLLKLAEFYNKFGRKALLWSGNSGRNTNVSACIAAVKSSV